MAVKNEYDFGHTGYSVLCGRTQAVLQEGFQYAWIDPRDGSATIATAFSDHLIPIDTKERPRRIRRIAYRVHLSRIGKIVRAEISTSIDWRVPIDDGWNPDDLALCKRMISELRQKLPE